MDANSRLGAYSNKYGSYDYNSNNNHNDNDNENENENDNDNDNGYEDDNLSSIV